MLCGPGKKAANKAPPSLERLQELDNDCWCAGCQNCSPTPLDAIRNYYGYMCDVRCHRWCSIHLGDSWENKDMVIYKAGQVSGMLASCVIYGLAQLELVLTKI